MCSWAQELKLAAENMGLPIVFGLSLIFQKKAMNKIKEVIKNKYFGYLLDLAIVFVGVAILSSGAGFVIDHRTATLGILLLVLLIRGIC